MTFFVLTTLVLATIWIYLLSGLSWLVESSADECHARTLTGKETCFSLSMIRRVTISKLGWLSTVSVDLKQDRFWSLQRARLVFPVRGPFLSNQGPLNELLRNVDPDKVFQPLL